MPNYTSKSLRVGRYSEPGRPYLLTTVVLARQPVFLDWSLGRHVVTELRRAQASGRVTSLAWVLMPDHLHWLIELHSSSLANVIREVKSRSARSFNRHTGRAGPLWQASFHDRALRREENVVAAARYVVANPLRAGLVERLGDYPLWDAVWV